MSPSRLEIKVGLFVFLCLALVAVLLIKFSKGTTFLHPTYHLKLESSTAGGLKRQAAVLMSGVQVGYVSDIKLSPEGTNVFIQVTIYGEYTILTDARFVIEQSGFLGDQFVAIYPDQHRGTRLQNDALVHVREPFNLLEVARSAAEFIRDVDVAATNLNDAINDVRRNVLNEKTLTNLASAIDTLQKVSENAVQVVEDIKGLVASNTVPAGAAVSNLLAFSTRMEDFARSAQELLKTNQPQINSAVNNLQVSTTQLTNFLNDARQSKGVVGTLINNQELAGNLSGLVSNLNAYSGYVRTNSLWHVIFRQPPQLAPTNAAAAPPARKTSK